MTTRRALERAPAPDGAKTFAITNVAGVRDFTITLEPGVNELRGENGSGKSSAIAAIARAIGGAVPLEVRDGAERGTVEGPGVHLVVGRKAVRATGEPSIELAAGGPLSNLIDPPFKDADARARARIRALLELVHLPIDDEVVSILAGHDPELAGLLVVTVKEQAIEDLLELAEHARNQAHALARRDEEAALTLAGKAGGHKVRCDELLVHLGGTERLIDLDPELAGQQERNLSREYDVGRHRAEARATLEARQVQIRNEIGPRPDPGAFDAPIAEAEGSLRLMREEESRLQQLLWQCREAIAVGEELLATQRRDKDAEVGQLERWVRLDAELQATVEGPTPDELEELGQSLEQARGRTIAARLSNEYRTLHEAGAKAAQEAGELQDRAAALRELAVTTHERLGELLQDTEASGLTVTHGRLAAIGADGEARDFETRLSDGQRVDAALRVVARVHPGKVVALDGRYWMALDPQHKTQFALLARDLGLFVVTESPTAGELRGEVFGERSA